MDKWEYLAAQLDYGLGSHFLTARISGQWTNANELGQQGWELITIAKTPLGHDIGIFKRRVTDGAAKSA